MKNVYEIRRLPDHNAHLPLSGAFDPAHIPEPYRSLQEAAIDHYEWGGEYRPKAFARVGWNPAGLFVLMYALEETIRIKETKFNGRVCEDSCLEFFIMPDPEKDSRYANVEVSAGGIGHIGIGEGRGNRKKPPEPPAGFSVTASEHKGGWWAVSYGIPKDFLEAEFGHCLLPGQKMRGNFYKCDESIHPHFGAHFPVMTERPDFHRPEYFGEIILK